MSLTDADHDATEHSGAVPDVEAVADLPPSCKYVFATLAREGALTHKALAECSLLPSRTVRTALRRLQSAGVVVAEPFKGDARQEVYRLDVDGGGDGR